MADIALPTVSLIIPTYNMARYLGDALDSALSQTVPFSQIIVIDDGSTDGTQDELARFDGQIQMVRQDNLGVSVARNVGLNMATGELVAFLDADDVVVPDRLARQLRVFQHNPSVQFSDGWSHHFWCPQMPDAARQDDHRYRHDFWHKPHAGHISTWMVRRDVFDQVGLFEPGRAYSEDTDWRLRSKTMGIVSARVDGYISRRRLHPTNVTRFARKDQALGLLQAIHHHRMRSVGGVE